MNAQHKLIVDSLNETLMSHPDRVSIIRKVESMLASSKTPEEGISKIPELIMTLTEETNKRGAWKTSLV